MERTARYRKETGWEEERESGSEPGRRAGEKWRRRRKHLAQEHIAFPKHQSYNITRGGTCPQHEIGIHSSRRSLLPGVSQRNPPLSQWSAAYRVLHQHSKPTGNTLQLALAVFYRPLVSKACKCTQIMNHKLVSRDSVFKRDLSHA